MRPLSLSLLLTLALVPVVPAAGASLPGAGAVDGCDAVNLVPSFPFVILDPGCLPPHCALVVLHPEEPPFVRLHPECL